METRYLDLLMFECERVSCLTVIEIARRFMKKHCFLWSHDEFLAISGNPDYLENKDKRKLGSTRVGVVLPVEK